MVHVVAAMVLVVIVVTARVFGGACSYCHGFVGACSYCHGLGGADIY